jgi:hypothetical protein
MVQVAPSEGTMHAAKSGEQVFLDIRSLVLSKRRGLHPMARSVGVSVLCRSFVLWSWKMQIG